MDYTVHGVTKSRTRLSDFRFRFCSLLHSPTLTSIHDHRKNHSLDSNYHTIALIPHATKVMLKILQARLQQYENHELPDVQACYKAEEPEVKLATSAVSSKKQELCW